MIVQKTVESNAYMSWHDNKLIEYQLIYAERIESYESYLKIYRSDIIRRELKIARFQYDAVTNELIKRGLQC